MTENVCIVCHSPSELICQRCRERYCSRQCQQDDWPQHKLTCFPMPYLVRPKNFKSENAKLLDRKPQAQIKVEKNLLEIELPTLSSELEEHVSLRPPKTKLLTSDEERPLDKPKTDIRNAVSVFNNPFKRNSENIGFKSNEVRASLVGLGRPVTKESIRMPRKAEMGPVKSSNVQARLTFARAMATIEPTNETIQPVKVTEPATVIEPPKEVIEPAKEIIEPAKEVFEPAKEIIEPAKEIIEPAKEIIEPPKDVIEPAKAIVEPAETATSIKTEPQAPQLIKVIDEVIDHQPANDLKISDSLKAEPDVQKSLPKFEPWMKSIPIDEKAFVPVIVQYIAPDGCWVILEKNARANNNLLREINKGISAASTPELDEVKVNSLFRVPFEEIYYRGVVLEPITEAGTVLVRLIDYGNEVIVPVDQLKSAVPAMRIVNAFAFPIQFETKREMNVDDVLNVKVKTMKDDVITVIVEGDQQLVSINDIEIVSIPAGKPLYCLDFSNIARGFISACVHDEKAIALIDSIAAKITEYCEGIDEPYRPELDEICLTKFVDDQWYRAVVSNVIDADNFVITFIDFGNSSNVSSANIRKIPQQFTHHCLVNKCYIKDFPDKPQKELYMSLARFFDENPSFKVKSLEAKNGAYIIEPILEK